MAVTLLEIIKEKLVRERNILQSPEELIDFISASTPEEEIQLSSMIIAVINADNGIGRKLLDCLNDIPARRPEKFFAMRKLLLERGLNEVAVNESIGILAEAIGMKAVYGEGVIVNLSDAREIIKQYKHNLEFYRKQNERLSSDNKRLRDLLAEERKKYSDSNIDLGKILEPYTQKIIGYKKAEKELKSAIRKKDMEMAELKIKYDDICKRLAENKSD